MTSYPVYLTALDEQTAVVVGTGPSAERKLTGLLEAGAQVTLIDPDPPHKLREWGVTGRIEWCDRTYEAGDLEGAVLVIVTEAAPENRARIQREAKERNVLINVTGDSAQSTFANGSCIRRGPLVISVSTSGAAPALSVRLRDQLADTVGPEYEALLDIMKALRTPMQRYVPDFQERRARWYDLLDSDVLHLLAQDRRTEALTRVEAIVGGKVMAEAEGCLP